MKILKLVKKKKKRILKKKNTKKKKKHFLILFVFSDIKSFQYLLEYIHLGCHNQFFNFEFML